MARTTSRSVRIPGAGASGSHHDGGSDPTFGHQARRLAQRVLAPPRRPPGSSRPGPASFAPLDRRRRRHVGSTNPHDVLWTIASIVHSCAPSSSEWRVGAYTRHDAATHHHPPPHQPVRRGLGDRARRVRRDLSLDDIARRVASSRRQLQRAYAEIGGTTFREHLTEVRMDRAADCSPSRDLTVREVAQRVGYRQPAQFAKAFRRRHGSPRRLPQPGALRGRARHAATPACQAA